MPLMHASVGACFSDEGFMQCKCTYEDGLQYASAHRSLSGTAQLASACAFAAAIAYRDGQLTKIFAKLLAGNYLFQK